MTIQLADATALLWARFSQYFRDHLHMKIPASIGSILASTSLFLSGTSALFAQDTLQDVLKDKNVEDFWHYDNLDAAMSKAEETGKPLLVTIRCVPCKACLGMDSKVVNPTDGELRELMGKFVCVRIVQAWGLDLSLFQYDMNMSWAAFMMNADRVIYCRYGTRAAQRDDSAITVLGFKKALADALVWHKRYTASPDETAPKFAAKRGPEPIWKRTQDIPAIPKTIRWDKRLGRMTLQQTNSCVHCHFVPAAEMMGLMQLKKPITDRHLWAYPLPETIGLSLDPGEKATIIEVADDSHAARAGLKPGDRIDAINGQPILSVADVQWALHRSDDHANLELAVERSLGVEESIALELPKGWRRSGTFVDRASSWDLFKVKLFGVAKMRKLSDEERAKSGVKESGMALRVEKLAPSWGGMNKDVRKAGLEEGDVVVKVDERTNISNHSELLAYLVQQKSSGDTLSLTVLRENQRLLIKVPLRWNDRISALRTP